MNKEAGKVFMTTPQINDSTLLSKNKKFSTTVLPDGNWIFFYAPTNRVIVTSPTAGIFWELCTGKSKLEKIIQEVSKFYPAQDVKDIKNDVFKIAPTLIKHKLLTFK